MHFLLLLVCLFSFSYAKIYFTKPVSTTIWKAGELVFVSWIPDPRAEITPEAPVVLELLYGDPKAFTKMENIGETVPEKVGHMAVRLSDKYPGNMYALRSGDSYSSKFVIINDKIPAGTPLNGTITTKNETTNATGGGKDIANKVEGKIVTDAVPSDSRYMMKSSSSVMYVVGLAIGLSAAGIL